eukprot:CAMPEP_0197900852 /NCGR_PEP_ID=MMETSP1439-20131203/50080_1 /TAXON_ID=66791 /ORGANISM="Gonyaulax spinifera, Strain CCMP409" /LENGTH=44 /DNA_ID= /DNA_START= /DNA_END= /DNA_ORIENTATION=
MGVVCTVLHTGYWVFAAALQRHHQFQSRDLLGGSWATSGPGPEW